MKTTLFETIRNKLTSPVTVINFLAEGKTVAKSVAKAAKNDMDEILRT